MRIRMSEGQKMKFSWIYSCAVTCASSFEPRAIYRSSNLIPWYALRSNFEWIIQLWYLQQDKAHDRRSLLRYVSRTFPDVFLWSCVQAIHRGVVGSANFVRPMILWLTIRIYLLSEHPTAPTGIHPNRSFSSLCSLPMMYKVGKAPWDNPGSYLDIIDHRSLR